jgi:hypothetical protein
VDLKPSQNAKAFCLSIAFSDCLSFDNSIVNKFVNFVQRSLRSLKLIVSIIVVLLCLQQVFGKPFAREYALL